MTGYRQKAFMKRLGEKRAYADFTPRDIGPERYEWQVLKSLVRKGYVKQHEVLSAVVYEWAFFRNDKGVIEWK